MPTEKNLTGCPSIDRPQEKYYRCQPVREIETEQTIYELIFNSNKNNMTAPAIAYMGVTWSFEQLKKEYTSVVAIILMNMLCLLTTKLVTYFLCIATAREIMSL